GFRWCIAPIDIFHVNVKNTIGKFINKSNIINMLISQISRIVIESERRMVIEGFQSKMCCMNIKCDFSRMDFKSKFYSKFLKFIKDRGPAPSEFFVSFFNRTCRYRVKGVKHMPYRASGKTHYCVDS